MDTTTVNYFFNKLGIFANNISPTIKDLSENYVKYYCFKSLTGNLTCLILFILFTSFFIFSFKKYKSEGNKSYGNEEAWGIISFITGIISGILLICSFFCIYDTVLIYKYPYQYTIDHVISGNDK